MLTWSELSDVVLVQHLPGLQRVDSVELLRRICSRIDQDGVGTSRMKPQKLGAVVDSVVHLRRKNESHKKESSHAVGVGKGSMLYHNPRRVSVAVLCDFR